MKKFLTREDELLTILMEECGEVTQACSKVIRFGSDQNYENLQKEIGDLMCMLELMSEDGLIDWPTVTVSSLEKRNKLKKFSNLLTSEDD